jgi:hypothetical protein
LFRASKKWNRKINIIIQTQKTGTEKGDLGAGFASVQQKGYNFSGLQRFLSLTALRPQFLQKWAAG